MALLSVQRDPFGAVQYNVVSAILRCLCVCSICIYTCVSLCLFCVSVCLFCVSKSTRQAAAGQRRTAGPGGSVYCACHELCTPGSPSAVPATKSTRQVAPGQRRPRAPQLVREALCTAPATKSALQVHQAAAPATKPTRQPAAGQRRPRTPEICTPGSPSAVPATKSTRPAAAGQRRRAAV